MNYYRISILITLWMNGGRQGNNGFSDLNWAHLGKEKGKGRLSKGSSYFNLKTWIAGKYRTTFLLFWGPEKKRGPSRDLPAES